MIYEYGLEPELVATWGNRADFNFFINAFGLGQPRMVSEFPKLKNWRRKVLQALPSTIADLDRERVLELVRTMTERMVTREEGHYDGSKEWLENAEREHARIPFHAILAHDNPNNHPDIIVANSLNATDTRWDVQRSKVVCRQAADMAAAVSDMLSNCREAIFVDPHFGPELPRYRRPFSRFLHAVTINRGGNIPDRIVVIGSNRNPNYDFFRGECESRFPRLIPAGIDVIFVRIRQLAGGEAVHNRYILTELGGVTFQHGLDDGRQGETDDVALMDRKQYEQRWEQYCGNNPVFDMDGDEFEVAGTG
ncbi:MAG TPA: hypothetical protein ENJ35_07010 [Gammaproteobacteria bacterium]|nr:hypothetical protein [Gammaproteobacteria bacterium]